MGLGKYRAQRINNQTCHMLSSIAHVCDDQFALYITILIPTIRIMCSQHFHGSFLKQASQIYNTRNGANLQYAYTKPSNSSVTADSARVQESHAHTSEYRIEADSS